MSSNDLNMNTSQQASPGPSAPSSPSPSLANPVTERVPDSNAHYQIKCFNAYLWDLSMQSQSARESQLSSIARRIKSGYRQLPNPKHILAMIRFNDQGKMHFKFWLRMNNPWPFTGSVEEMELWHEVDALSTQLYEMIYDQAQINLKQQVENQAEKLTNAPNGQGVGDVNGNSDHVNRSVNEFGSASSHVQENPQNGTNENVLNGNGDDVDRSINVSSPKTSRDITSGQENPLNSSTEHDLSLNTPGTSMRSGSSKIRNSPRIPSTGSFIKISRRSNPPKRTSPRKAISKSSIASRPSRKSDPKPPKALITKSSKTSDSISASKSQIINTSSTTPSTSTPPSPSQPSSSTSTSSQSIITNTLPFTKIQSKCPLHPNKICTTYQCRIGDCTKVYHDRGKFRIHQRSHTGVMPFRCTVSGCSGFASARKDLVQIHIQSKHYSGTKKDTTFLNQFIETDKEALKGISSKTSANSDSSPPSKSNCSKISTNKSPIVAKASRKPRSQSPKTLLISKSAQICSNETLTSESSTEPKSPISKTQTPTISTITPPTPPQPTYPIITETPHYTKTVSQKLHPKRTSTMYRCRIGECTKVMNHFNKFKHHQQIHYRPSSNANSISISTKPSSDSKISICNSSIASKASEKSDSRLPKTLIFKSSKIFPSQSSTPESSADPKIGPSQTRTSTIATINSPTRSSTITYPIITKTEHYTKTVSQSQLNPKRTLTTYQCNIGDCTRIISDSNKFKIHQRTHTGVKPYRCSVSGCSGYAAVTRSQVRRHIQSMHYPKSKKDITFLNQFVEIDEEMLNSSPSTISRKSKSRSPIKENSLRVSANKSSRNTLSSKNSTTKSSFATRGSRKSISRSPKTLIFKSKKTRASKSTISETIDSPRSRRSQVRTSTTTPTPTQPSISSNLNILANQTYIITNSKSLMYQCRIDQCTVTMSNWFDFKHHQFTHLGIKPYRCSVSGCSGFASAYKVNVRRHIQSKHYSNSKKNREFLNQFIETDEELLNSIPSMTCIKSDSIPQSKFNSPKASTKIKSSNISNSSKISKMKPSIAFKTSRKSVSRISKTLVSKSSSESPTTGLSTISRSRRSQTNTTITSTPTPTQPSTSSNPNNTETQFYTITNSMYQCHIGQCTVTMSNWYNFKIHQLSHTGVKPFRCSVSGCSGYAAVQKYLVRSHIQLKHYPKSKKEATFLNQFIETDQKFLNSIPSKTSMKSDSRPPIIANSPKALTTVKSSNISLSSKVSKMKPSIAYKTTRRSETRLPKTLMSKSLKESSTIGSSENFRSRRSQTRTFTTTPTSTPTPTLTSTQPSTSSNSPDTGTPSYDIDSNNSNSTKISTWKSSIASKASCKSDSKTSKAFISKSSRIHLSKHSTSKSSNTSRRTQVSKTTIPPTPPQASTSANPIATETPLYSLTIIKDRGDPTKSRTIFNCRIGECTKVMHDLQRFRVHQQAHTDVKPYQCSVVDCDGYASSHKSKVLHHIRLVHYPETEDDTTLNQFVETDEEMLGWFA